MQCLLHRLSRLLAETWMSCEQDCRALSIPYDGSWCGMGWTPAVGGAGAPSYADVPLVTLVLQIRGPEGMNSLSELERVLSWSSFAPPTLASSFFQAAERVKVPQSLQLFIAPSVDCCVGKNNSSHIFFFKCTFRSAYEFLQGPLALEFCNAGGVCLCGTLSPAACM